MTYLIIVFCDSREEEMGEDHLRMRERERERD